jgi:hypothetical protein
MTARPDETILDTIERRLVPDIEAKKARGEVFTPLGLVREILYGIRKSDMENGDFLPWGVNKTNLISEDDDDDRIGGIPLELWRDPDTKWLDLANGIGNFPFVAFHMLDFQLKHHGTKGAKEWTDEKRRKHIVEKMLFMIEIDKGNVNTSRKVMEYLVTGCTPNICCANTLKLKDEDLQRHFGVNRFDVVMANPPFNEGGTKYHVGRGLYSKFVQFAIQTLTARGCLAFITPPNYHRIDKDDKEIKVRQFFSDNDVLFLRMIPNTKKYFDVQISIDYYVVRKGKFAKGATILDKYNVLTREVDLAAFTTIPNFGFSAIQRLQSLQSIHGRFNAKYGRNSTSHTSRKDLFIEGVFPVVHLINTNGIRVLLTKKKHPLSDTPKIIINGLGLSYVLDDSSGKYGVTEFSIYVITPSNNEKIFLMSRLFQYLILAFKIQAPKNDLFVFEILPDFNKFDFTDEESMIRVLGLEDIKDEINKFKVPTFLNVEKIEKRGGTIIDDDEKSHVTQRKEKTSSRKTRRSPSIE